MKLLNVIGYQDASKIQVIFQESQIFCMRKTLPWQPFQRKIILEALFLCEICVFFLTVNLIELDHINHNFSKFLSKNIMTACFLSSVNYSKSFKNKRATNSGIWRAEFDFKRILISFLKSVYRGFLSFCRQIITRFEKTSICLVYVYHRKYILINFLSTFFCSRLPTYLVPRHCDNNRSISYGFGVLTTH